MTFDLPTFLFQAVNFVVLVAILWRILWKPLRNHMTARAERISTELSALDEERLKLEGLRAHLEDELERARGAGAEARERGEREARERATQILSDAHEAASKELSRVRTQVHLEQERREKEFVRNLVPELTQLMTRILTELGGGELHRLTCDRLAHEIEGLPAEERDSLRRKAMDARVVLMTAQPEATVRLRKAVSALLPPDVEAAMKEDGGLGAGARLCIGETVLDGSLAAQAISAMEPSG